MSADPQLQTVKFDSLYDIVASGGPLMWPIAVSSIVALTCIVERAIGLREKELGSHGYGRAIVDALASGGPERALVACKREARPLGRILRPALLRAQSQRLERARAVEDAGARELQRLNARLRPLAVAGVLAALLGFLGTLFGMIQAFVNIALRQGMGKPEQLAAGISHALVTTAAGLCVAIPAHAAYYWFRAKIDRFAGRTEDLFVELDEGLTRASLSAGAKQ